VNKEELLKDHCPGCGTLPPLWGEVDSSIAGPEGLGPRWHCTVCDEYRVIVPFEASDHEPERGSEVEAFIRRERERYTALDEGGNPDEWHALDALLDRYRLLADNGRSLKDDRETTEGD